jgi:5S rRNA maturation endonuclease (ribonuclease M5)
VLNQPQNMKTAYRQGLKQLIKKQFNHIYSIRIETDYRQVLNHPQNIETTYRQVLKQLIQKQLNHI